jgi:hypothetical protein
MLEPGRYELSWYQKVEPGCSTTHPLYATVRNMSANGGENWRVLADDATFLNTVPDAWERKRLLINIEETLNSAYIYFYIRNSSTDGIRIDDIALVKAPVDPSISPSNISYSITPSECIVYWDTPSDPSVTNIICRTGKVTHPLTTNDGQYAGAVIADNGKKQSMSFAVNWANKLYLSLFGQQSSGFTGPEIKYIIPNIQPPTVTQLYTVNISPTMSISHWTAVAKNGAVINYRYAIGTSPNGSNILGWKDTQDTSAEVNLLLNATLYITVKAEDSFGNWSAPVTKLLSCNVGGLKLQPDNECVFVSSEFAVVSAVFGDCYYVESPDRSNAIKIIGIAPVGEGSHVSIDGAISTLNGERCVIPSPAP